MSKRIERKQEKFKTKKQRNEEYLEIIKTKEEREDKDEIEIITVEDDINKYRKYKNDEYLRKETKKHGKHRKK